MNSARRLHDTLTDWKERHAGATSVSIARDLDTDVGMEDQLHAIDDLRLVELGIADLDELGVKTSTSVRYLPQWRRMVLGYPDGWTGGIGAESVYPTSALDQLDNLADRFDDRWPEISSEAEDRLRAAASRAAALVEEDETISEALRLYIQRLLREIDAAFDDEALGGRFDYEDAAKRLWVSLFAAAEQSSDSTAKSKWSEAAKNFFWPAAASALGAAPQTILAIATASGAS